MPCVICVLKVLISTKMFYDKNQPGYRFTLFLEEIKGTINPFFVVEKVDSHLYLTPDLSCIGQNKNN